MVILVSNSPHHALSPAGFVKQAWVHIDCGSDGFVNNVHRQKGAKRCCHNTDHIQMCTPHCLAVRSALCSCSLPLLVPSIFTKQQRAQHCAQLPHNLLRFLCHNNSCVSLCTVHQSILFISLVSVTNVAGFVLAMVWPNPGTAVGIEILSLLLVDFLSFCQAELRAVTEAYASLRVEAETGKEEVQKMKLELEVLGGSEGAKAKLGELKKKIER